MTLFLCIAAFFHDGDNIRCGGRTMRLARIDAPEFTSSPKCRQRRRSTVCDDRAAAASRDHLRALVGRDPVRCEVLDASPRMPGFQRSDAYGRPVVRCFVRGVDLGQTQIARGHAVSWS